jgi:UDPglucose--hexose-1-phosphate uridylyltransferase
MAEIRRDPLSGNWIVIGYHLVESDRAGPCPFCPGNESLTPPSIREYKDKDGRWLVRCFPAHNPVFQIEAREDKRAEGIYDKMGNVGAHEIVVENRAHTKTLSGFSRDELFILLDFYRERLIDLKKDKRFKYIVIFKNHGELVGSHISHPHSHIVATPILSLRAELEIMNLKSHYERKERCLICDIIAQEIRQKKRVVTMNQGFIAICPFASRFPYEVLIAPRNHIMNYEDVIDNTKKYELVDILLDIMKRIELLVNSYTIVIHTSPNIVPDILKDGGLPMREYFHWHIEILPMDIRSLKLKREDEFYVLHLAPEDAAASLREQKLS